MIDSIDEKHIEDIKQTTKNVDSGTSNNSSSIDLSGFTDIIAETVGSIIEGIGEALS